jgi:hypothetical protein
MMATAQFGHRPVIQVLHVQDCPNYPQALALVQQVRAEVGIDAELRTTLITDQAAAEEARFLGSPTIRVNGRDIEPGAEWNFEFVHGCRLYQGEHSLRALPEDEWLRQALRNAEPQP